MEPAGLLQFRSVLFTSWPQAWSATRRRDYLRQTRPRDGNEQEDQASGFPRRPWGCARQNVGGRRSTPGPRRLDVEKGQSIFCQSAGEPLLEAFLQSRPGRSRRRYARNQPADESGVAGCAGEKLRRKPLRPEKPRANDLPVAGLSTHFAAQQVQRRG